MYNTLKNALIRIKKYTNELKSLYGKTPLFILPTSYWTGVPVWLLFAGMM